MKLSTRAQTLQESAIRKLDRYNTNNSWGRFLSTEYWSTRYPDTPSNDEGNKRVQTNVLSYGPASGTPACRSAFAKYHSRWQSSLTAEHVAVTTGGSEALLFCLHSHMRSWG